MMLLTRIQQPPRCQKELRHKEVKATDTEPFSQLPWKGGGQLRYSESSLCLLRLHSDMVPKARTGFRENVIRLGFHVWP